MAEAADVHCFAGESINNPAKLVHHDIIRCFIVRCNCAKLNATAKTQGDVNFANLTRCFKPQCPRQSARAAARFFPECSPRGLESNHSVMVNQGGGEKTLPYIIEHKCRRQVLAFF